MPDKDNDNQRDAEGSGDGKGSVGAVDNGDPQAEDQIEQPSPTPGGLNMPDTGSVGMPMDSDSFADLKKQAEKPDE